MDIYIKLLNDVKDEKLILMWAKKKLLKNIFILKNNKFLYLYNIIWKNIINKFIIYKINLFCLSFSKALFL